MTTLKSVRARQVAEDPHVWPPALAILRDGKPIGRQCGCCGHVQIDGAGKLPPNAAYSDLAKMPSSCTSVPADKMEAVRKIAIKAAGADDESESSKEASPPASNPNAPAVDAAMAEAALEWWYGITPQDFQGRIAEEGVDALDRLCGKMKRTIGTINLAGGGHMLDAAAGAVVLSLRQKREMAMQLAAEERSRSREARDDYRSQRITMIEDMKRQAEGGDAAGAVVRVLDMLLTETRFELERGERRSRTKKETALARAALGIGRTADSGP